MAAVLTARAVSKRFGATRALSEVDLRLAAGERLAVLGENGAGKSTLMKILAGVYPPDSGAMTLDGRPYRPGSPADALAAGVSIVYQEPSFFARLTVLENLFVGREPRAVGGGVHWRRMRSAAHDLFTTLEMPVDLLGLLMGELSLAEQQLVLIARAVDQDSKVLILDEPTSILTARETDRLFGLIDQLARRGVAILYITHRFDELKRVADRFVVLKDGQLAGELPAENADHDRIIELMTGRALERAEPTGRGGVSAPVLELDTLTAPGRYSDVSLTVGGGEIVGLYGLVGAGRTELALTVFGVLKPSRGRMRLGGRPYAPRSARHAMAQGVAYLPEDRKTQGIFPSLSVGSNLTAATLPRLTRRLGVLNTLKEDGLVGTWIRRLNIKVASATDDILSLSGGHQQKVLLARCLATDPKVLVLDEPTRGIDVGTKAELHRMIIDLARGGLAVLVISSELPELLALAERVYVLREGAVAAEFTQGAITEQAVLRATLGAS